MNKSGFTWLTSGGAWGLSVCSVSKLTPYSTTGPLATTPWPSEEFHSTLRLVGDRADTSGGAIHCGTVKTTRHRLECLVYTTAFHRTATVAFLRLFLQLLPDYLLILLHSANNILLLRFLFSLRSQATTECYKWSKWIQTKAAKQMWRSCKIEFCSWWWCELNGFKHSVILCLGCGHNDRLNRRNLLLHWCRPAMKYAVKCDFLADITTVTFFPTQQTYTRRHSHTLRIWNAVITCLLSRRTA